jgi:hypothetical protein
MAAGAAALLLVRPAPAPPPVMDPAPAVVPSAAAALAAWLDGAAGVVAFGEVHQDTATAGTRSALARFTDDVLPALAPRASHLIVETWMTTGSCGEKETRVTEDIARTTERPKETESEIVRLLRRAKEAGVAPHVLAVTCDEYASLTSGGRGSAVRVDYDKLLRLTERHLETAIRQALLLPRTTERPLVLVYGGALHNDLHPVRTLAPYAFGPAIFAAAHGDYREVDLYVPELVERNRALRAEPWFPAWRAFGHERETVVIPRSGRSTIVVFARDAPPPHPSPSPLRGEGR